MKRRKFLKYTAPMAMAPLVITGASAMRPFATRKMVTALTCDGIGERVLVLIQLKGGNDGLNTIIPIDQLGVYNTLRPDIAISNYIPLDNTLPMADQVGLNPAMTAIKNMYDSGMVNLIQGVGYTNQNKSHFKSRDLYWTGGDGLPENSNIDTGWMGRYLEATFPDAGSGSSSMEDPLGIQIGGSKPSFGFHTNNINPTAINLYGQDPAGYFNLVSSIGGDPVTNIPASEYGDEIDYILGIENNVNTYAERITTVFNNGSNSATTYPDTDLANQLKTIARLISGGSQTKIYLASIGGFDTHNNQVEQGATGTGKHAELWTQIGEAVQAFTTDLSNLSLEQKVMTMTFSEFGRKAAQNGNYGTDHGTLSNMFIFGSAADAGITGTNVDLSNLDGQQLQGIQNDCRQVFSTLIQDWLGAADETVALSFPTGAFQKVPVVDPASIVDPSCYVGVLPVELSFFEARVIDNKEVALEWVTASEFNSDYFDIERSNDGKDFMAIGQVTAKGSAADYEFLDEEPLDGVSYYRLRQVDLDEKMEYSEVRTVEIKDKTIKKIRLSPNPAVFNSFVNFTAYKTTTASLKVVNIQGVTQRDDAIEIREGFNKFPIDVTSFAPGIYAVFLEDRNGTILGQEQLMVAR